MAAEGAPYWQSLRSIAPIKAEFVLWDRVNAGKTSKPASNAGDDDDDAAEDHTFKAAHQVDGERPAKKARTEEPKKRKGGQNKGKERQVHNAPKTPISAQLCPQMARGSECTRAKEGGCKFLHDLPQYLSSKVEDLSLASLDDIEKAPKEDLADMPKTPTQCPLYAIFGMCFYGWKCRFLRSHVKTVEDGQGAFGTSLELLFDEAKMRAVLKKSLAIDAERVDTLPIHEVSQMLSKEKGELNVVLGEQQRLFRGKRAESFPLTSAFFDSIGEPWGNKEDSPRDPRGGKRGRGRAGTQHGGTGDRSNLASGSVPGDQPAAAHEASANEAFADSKQVETKADQEAKSYPSQELSSHAKEMELDSSQTKDAAQDDAEIEIILDQDQVNGFSKQSHRGDRPPVAPREKRSFVVRNKLYLAPLTTTGNLPFRRLCVGYGADITCGEMGLATEFLAGNPSEWSLVRRHPSERMFGVQIAGGRPAQLVPAGEAIMRACPDLDFLDVNYVICGHIGGCPIDLVFNKGAGSALMSHAARLTTSLIGLSNVLGEIPVTFKMRMGVKDGDHIAHKLAARASRECNVSAVTLHGRTRQQRYSRLADHEYIANCVRHLRSVEEAEDLPRLPFIGNGDAYNHQQFWETIEKTKVDTLMIARGALIKPWIFTEIKERRDWDISARERLDGVRDLVNFGLEHWGTDVVGMRETRRFVLEALSFQHRYIPVGILERFPVQMNERPFPFHGRNDLETLLASPDAADWQKVTDMFLGKPDDSFVFIPKHKSNSYGGPEG